MLRNVKNLAIEDKAFMVQNPAFFSLPTRATINFNMNEWENEVKSSMSSKLLKEEEDRKRKYMDAITTVAGKTNNEDTVLNFSRLYHTIWEAPCETKEDIKNILLLFNNQLTQFKSKKDVSIISIDISKDTYIKLQIKYFLKLLQFKLKAHEISTFYSGDIRPSGVSINDFTYTILRNLIDELVASKDENCSALVIYLILQYLHMDNKDFYSEIFTTMCKYISNLDPRRLSRIITKIDEGGCDSLKVIEQVDGMKCTPYSNIIQKEGKRIIGENFKKNKVSDIFRNGDLCIGDVVFDDNETSLENLITEITKLNTDVIKDYIGENKIINFRIDEKEVGYLKLKEKLPICKVLLKNGGFYTLTKYENMSYLLFKLYNDNKCYGISFPAEFKGSRKIVIFDVPEDRDYKLEI